MTVPTPAPTPPLAGGRHGADALRPLLDTALTALATGARERGGPLPAGGPDTVAARVAAALGDVLPARHRRPRSTPHPRAHPHRRRRRPRRPPVRRPPALPPLAVAAVADLAASVLNPSLDSWDQAPAASAIEAHLTRTLATELYGTPAPTPSSPPAAPKPTNSPSSSPANATAPT